MTTPLDLAADVLAGVEGEAQVMAVRERSLTSRFSRSAPTQATEVDAHTVHVLCVVEGHTGGATAARVDRDALAQAARRARAAAEAAARGGPGAYPGLPEPRPARSHTGYDAATAELDPHAAGAALTAAFAAAAERGLEAYGLWSAGGVETAIVATTGLQAVDRVTDAYMKVLCRDSDGRSGFAAATGTGIGGLDGGALAHAAAAKVVGGEPATLPPGEYPVVLEHEAVGTILEMLAYSAFNGLAHVEERGALAGRLGTRVAASCINLADSPRFTGTLPRAFDAEGVPKMPLPLIQDGVAHRVVHDTRSAAQAGGDARSTGHALEPGGALEGPAPTNLVLIGGGAADAAELAAPIERGLYVTRLWYVNVVHERTALLTGVTRDGTFLIEDGRISRPVRDVRFTDSGLRLLDATEALTAGQRLVSEGEFYGTRFASGVVCPALRAQGFRVTGGA
ncbi:MAG TPA: metallopeptidase TldD-related protein [Solirubrobacteraceae bacterium]